MARTDEGARPAPQAPRKALRIESHDTGAYKGRTTVRERAASAALSGAPAGGGQVQETAREALEALVASERSKGRRSRGRVSTALRSEVSGFFNSWLTSAAKLSMASMRA